MICGGTASMRFYKGGHVFALSASPSLPPLSVSLAVFTSVSDSVSASTTLLLSLPPVDHLHHECPCGTTHLAGN